MPYFQDTRRRSYSFLFAIVLLLLYEGAVALMRALGRGQIVNGVDAWFDYALAQVPHGTWIASLVVFLIGATFVYLDRKNGLELKRGVFIGMFVESCVWALGLFLLMPRFVFKLLNPNLSAAAPALQATEGHESSLALWEQIGLSFGAGFYEELFFRLLLVGVLMGLVKLFKGDPKHPLPQFVIAVVAAMLFSAVHYLGPLGDTFTFYSFAYRALMGLLFSGLLLLRGFGITAWTHGLYDVLVYVTRAVGV
ncbi:MAG: CPBP family glutamic-type intramembrane protease [Bacteroidia bacterium]|nr:CPBP family glutamic-type intramembrane protease [Bacteroidia bacterium]